MKEYSDKFICNCGCGEPLISPTRNDGKPRRFNYNHHMRLNRGKNHPMFGRHHSDRSRMKMSEARKGIEYSDEYRRKISDSNKGKKLGEDNPMWKGNDVSYRSLHEWVRNHLPVPKLCQDCKLKPPYDLANKSGKYLRDLSDWEYICRGCHMKKDGRLERLRYERV